MPEFLRWLPRFIKDVGFPVFAFCILAYFHFVSFERSIKVLGEVRDAMLGLKVALEGR